MTGLTGKSTLQILFFGDLVGKPGREAVKRYLSNLGTNRPDVVIANVENTSHGFGLQPGHYQDLLHAGVDIMTSGNHIWDRRELFAFVDEADRLLRPANFNMYSPGRGYGVFEVAGHKLGVVNLIGQVFMGNYNSPWESLEQIVPEMLNDTTMIFLDFHADATAEKNAMGHFAASLGVSAMTGTHTHVQTADERILNNHMGYITDAGFNGSHHSVIGFDPVGSVQRMKSQFPTKIDIASSPTLQVNAVLYELETASGICLSVKRINELL
jgi:metallophosphoesterase (TIGR00282 family)